MTLSMQPTRMFLSSISSPHCGCGVRACVCVLDSVHVDTNDRKCFQNNFSHRLRLQLDDGADDFALLDGVEVAVAT